MTISSEIRKAGPYQGTGTRVQFPFGFKILESSDVVVTVTTPLLVDALVAPGGYTVTMNADQDNNPGGYITLPVAVSIGYKLTITSALPYLQPTDITNSGGFYPQVIEDALDRATIQIQQLAEIVNRSAHGSPAVGSNVDFTIPAPGAGMLIGWNALGTGLALYSTSLAGSGSGGSGGTGSTGAVSGTGNGTTTRFSLGGIPATDPAQLLVVVNGLVKTPTTDYTVDISTQEVVFTAAPAAAAVISIRAMGSGSGSGAGGGSQLVYIGDTAPVSASDGLLWWSSADGNLRIAYHGAWVAAGPVAVGRGTAIPQSLFSLAQQPVTALAPTFNTIATIEVETSGLYPIVVTAIFSLAGATAVVPSAITGRTVTNYDGNNWMLNAGGVDAILRFHLTGSTPPSQMASVTVPPSQTETGAFAYTYNDLPAGIYTISLEAAYSPGTYSDERYGIRSVSLVAQETK